MFGALTVEFREQSEGEKEENKNKPKNHNILPKNSGGSMSKLDTPQYEEKLK